MADSNSKQWVMFFGGVVLGTAAAAGAGYAVARYYMQNALDLDGRKMQQRLPRLQHRAVSPNRRSIAGSRSHTPLLHTYAEDPLPLRLPQDQAIQYSRVVQNLPGSPRLEWLAREDVADDGPNGTAAALRTIPETYNLLQGRVTDDLSFLNQSNTTSARVTSSNAPDLERPRTMVGQKDLSLAVTNHDNHYTKAPASHVTDILHHPSVLVPSAEKHQKSAMESPLKVEEYSRLITPEAVIAEEGEEVCAMLLECLELRRKWLYPRPPPDLVKNVPEATIPSEINTNPLEYRPLEPSSHVFDIIDGVTIVYLDRTRQQQVCKLPGTASDFFSDMHRVLRYAALGPVKSFCHHRLMLLEQKFNLHVMLNADKEFLAQKSAPHRDFYNVRKVDTHIHHSACMHQKHLLRFIKSKLRKEPDEVVIFRDGKYLTLKEVFESLNLTGYDLNVDTLDMHADKNTFHRFDKFNLKYNPCGQSRLREIFIKQDNLIHGRFLAELTREVFCDIEASKYQHAELRISIYGRKQVEWDVLASWVVGNNLYSDNVIWLIQVPRLYNVYREQGIIENFQQMLDNLFMPLFEVTRDPSSHPQLHVFLSQVVGFDMVDDESKPERRPTKHSPLPSDWNSKHNAAYAYYAYYIYANLYSLNKFRESRGLNSFTFRPHAGEAGDVDHLTAGLMLCENIAHGINLRKSPCLQYLYYLAQIGLCMSPLSNNSLFLDYHRNPFPAFFARGLSVSLSTDDPLQIHLTKEPLVEEYSVAAQVWKLSATDLCEIARNGVMQSGFPSACKKHWVSERYWIPGPEGNDIHKTNVPNLRLRFRQDTYNNEMQLVLNGAIQQQNRKLALANRNEST